MFTGIITHIGQIAAISQNENSDVFLQISTNKNIDRKLEIGCSIALNGICLTLVKKEITDENYLLSFEASEETKTKTTLKNWQKNQLLNMEFAARFGDEIGGHLVLGHVDDVAQITNISQNNDSHIFTFKAPQNLSKFIAPKCSVVLNGTSLTVNDVNDNIFTVNIIPHTLKNTIFQNLKINDLVNLEIDVIARYILKDN